MLYALRAPHCTTSVTSVCCIARVVSCGARRVQLPRFTDFFVSAEDCGTSSLFPPLSHTGNERPKASRRRTSAPHANPKPSIFRVSHRPSAVAHSSVPLTPPHCRFGPCRPAADGCNNHFFARKLKLHLNAKAPAAAVPSASCTLHKWPAERGMVRGMLCSTHMAAAAHRHSDEGRRHRAGLQLGDALRALPVGSVLSGLNVQYSSTLQILVIQYPLRAEAQCAPLPPPLHRRRADKRRFATTGEFSGGSPPRCVATGSATSRI